MLNGQVYYQKSYYDTTAKNALQDTDVHITDPALMESTLTRVLTDPNTQPDPVKTLTYIRSEYAPAYQIQISKTYKNTSQKLLHAGDRVEVDISITNSGTTLLKDLEYLDTIPSIFDPADTRTYSVGIDTAYEERPFTLSDDTYDARFTLPDIPVGKTLHIKYSVTALATSYGEMLVGNYE